MYDEHPVRPIDSKSYSHIERRIAASQRAKRACLGACYTFTPTCDHETAPLDQDLLCVRLTYRDNN